jgi:hypothetical protein
MSKKVIIGASVLCLIFPAATFAQGFRQGDKTFLLSGSGANDDDFANFVFNVEAYLGYFFTDNVSGTIQQGVSWIDVPGSDDDWALATRLALDYNWNLDNWSPYLGVHIGYLWGDRVRDTFIWGPQAGVRYFVNPTTFILGEIQWEIFERSGGTGETFDDDRVVYTFGIGFRWQ